MGKAVQRAVRHRGAGRIVAAGLCAVGLALALAACSNVSQSLGLGKNAPDEFAVVRNPPLSLPPDLTLRPPRPGERPTNEVSARDQAETLLLSEAGGDRAAEAVQATETPGEAALIAHADAADVDPDIRDLVERDYSGYAYRDESFVEALMFWRSEDPPGEVVDPEAEAERLRENIEAGKPVTEGETPTIERREKALLEGIF